MSGAATAASLRPLAAEAQAWLYGKALPLWLAHGVDRARGGFHETLDPDGLACAVPYKRLRVTTRQIYAFAEGARHGVPGARAAVEHGLAFLLGPLRHPEGGFARSCDRDGRIVDPARDLYDLAFTLFALGHAYRLTADAALRDEAIALLAFIDAHLRHPAGGYAEGLPAALPRRQNPHMHLLEAALACAELMPHPQFDRLCDDLADLAARRFIDVPAGVIREYYADDLVPEGPFGGALVEPGHNLEWAWLLTELVRVRGRAVAGGARLASFALARGLDADTGLLRGALFDDGAVADASVRLWPHCEWLKAALAYPDFAAGSPAVAWAALRRFLAGPQPGLWCERWDGRGFVAAPAPASTLYHLVSCITALARHAA
ncbi:AGE family epimerase/isomerase [Sphingomonas profundi]|uniref:AGE family epimerase/isomerase n=1 Tax=Alterirhizorhabdus profundi TaxID=2681549 RepID=UPI0018D013D6|nr:AGE family epimerase/isomerase [Sphingomonas profundi]